MLRIVVVVAFLALAAVAATAGELVPYQATGWKYRQVPWNDPLIGVFYTTSFDDSGWNLSQAAFGNFGEINNPEPFCTAVYTVHAQWDLSTDALLRRHFAAAPWAPVTVYLAIDNDATVYVNGIQVFNTRHEGCPLPDDFSVVVPTTILSPTGQNLLAICAHDRGGFSFVDVRVDGEIPAVGVETSTWGAIKTLFE